MDQRMDQQRQDQFPDDAPTVEELRERDLPTNMKELRDKTTIVMRAFPEVQLLGRAMLKHVNEQGWVDDRALPMQDFHCCLVMGVYTLWQNDPEAMKSLFDAGLQAMQEIAQEYDWKSVEKPGWLNKRVAEWAFTPEVIIEQYNEQQRQKKIDAKAEREAKKLAKNPRSSFRKGREIAQRSGGLGSPLFGRTRKPVEPLHAKVVSDVKPLRPIALATSKHFIP